MKASALLAIRSRNRLEKSTHFSKVAFRVRHILRMRRRELVALRNEMTPPQIQA